MSTTIADLKTRLQRKLHGTTINKLAAGFNDLVYEAAQNTLLRVDMTESKRISQITNALYDQVYSYVLPTDLKGDKIIDVRPQTDRTIGDTFNQMYQKDFSQYKENGTFAVESNSGIKTLKLSKSLTTGPTINDCNSLTTNGTWAAGGNATGLVADQLNYITGGGSLKFDISASGSTAYVENSTMAQIDLTNYRNQGAFFVWVYIPSTTIITSVNLRFGSDSSNYYTQTVTATHDQTAFVVGWNLLRFDWASTTTTGSPAYTAIDYLRVTFNYNGTATTNVRVDSIVARLGTIYEIVYYSRYLFQNSAGAWIEKPTDDSDVVNLDTESFNLLFYEICFLTAQEIQGSNASFDASFWKLKRDEELAIYMADHKSESLKKQTKYYRMPQRS